MKTMIFTILICLCLTGCTVRNVENSIVGQWELYDAKRADTGKKYSIQELYGTGIALSNRLTLNKDGTFSKYIGITDNLTSYEGRYTIHHNTIIFQFQNGNEEEAIYSPSNHEIEYFNTHDFSIPVNEYFRMVK